MPSPQNTAKEALASFEHAPSIFSRMGYGDDNHITAEDVLAPFDRRSYYIKSATSSESNQPKGEAISQIIEREDALHPMNWPAWKRWGIIAVYALLQIFVSMSSTTIYGAESIIFKQWNTPDTLSVNGKNQLVTLGQSLFLVGLALGPAFLAPLA